MICVPGIKAVLCICLLKGGILVFNEKLNVLIYYIIIYIILYLQSRLQNSWRTYLFSSFSQSNWNILPFFAHSVFTRSMCFSQQRAISSLDSNNRLALATGHGMYSLNLCKFLRLILVFESSIDASLYRQANSDKTHLFYYFLTSGIFTGRIRSLFSTDIALWVSSHRVIVKQLLMIC
jgi:hypothetical protein